MSVFIVKSIAITCADGAEQAVAGNRQPRAQQQSQSQTSQPQKLQRLYAQSQQSHPQQIESQCGPRQSGRRRRHRNSSASAREALRMQRPVGQSQHSEQACAEVQGEQREAMAQKRARPQLASAAGKTMLVSDSGQEIASKPFADVAALRRAARLELASQTQSLRRRVGVGVRQWAGNRRSLGQVGSSGSGGPQAGSSYRRHSLSVSHQ
jgi:hypothetical protein